MNNTMVLRFAAIVLAGVNVMLFSDIFSRDLFSSPNARIENPTAVIHDSVVVATINSTINRKQREFSAKRSDVFRSREKAQQPQTSSRREAFQRRVTTPQKPPALQIKGVLFSGSPLVIIQKPDQSTEILGVGDTILEQKILAIEKTKVRFRGTGGNYTLPVTDYQP